MGLPPRATATSRRSRRGPRAGSPPSSSPRCRSRAATTRPSSSRAFAGDDRYIVDYLVEEVLRRQPATTRDFLLETSILARFSGSLADAVTGRRRAAPRPSRRSSAANLFVVALDDQRRWYRYHHLFGAVLAAHLAAERPDDVPILHRRASDWFEAERRSGRGDRARLAGGRSGANGRAVELAHPEMRQYRREPTLRRWVGAPCRERSSTRRPVLARRLAGAILSANEVDAASRALLSRLERGLASPASRRSSPTRPSSAACRR